MKKLSERDRIIVHLIYARKMSDSTAPSEPYNIDKNELGLLADLIQEHYIRGQIMPELGPPVNAAMWGITLKGREYLATLQCDQDRDGLPSKIRRILWAIGGFVVGVLAPLAGEIALRAFDYFFKSP